MTQWFWITGPSSPCSIGPSSRSGPDCRLGVKRSTNQEQPDGSTEEKKELIWGYGYGVAVATTRDYGDVVLAEYTQPFNETVTVSVLLFG
jgi:hypothetical protein